MNQLIYLNHNYKSLSSVTVFYFSIQKITIEMVNQSVFNLMQVTHHIQAYTLGPDDFRENASAGIDVGRERSGLTTRL